MEVLVGRDESSQAEPDRCFVTYRLCHTDTTFLHTIYQSILHHFVLRRQLVELLHQHTAGPHQHRCHNEHHYQMTQEEWLKNLFRKMVKKRIMNNGGYCKRKKIGIRYRPQIHKRRITHHTCIGLEHPEPNHGYQYIDQDGMHDAPEVCDVIPYPVICPEHNQSCQECHQTVEDEHTPVRQCLLREVPISNFLKDIHSTINVSLCVA